MLPIILRNIYLAESILLSQNQNMKNNIFYFLGFLRRKKETSGHVGKKVNCENALFLKKSETVKKKGGCGFFFHCLALFVKKSRFLQKCQKHVGERTVSSINGAGKTGYPYAEE